jgi:hypothetical protein
MSFFTWTSRYGQERKVVLVDENTLAFTGDSYSFRFCPKGDLLLHSGGEGTAEYMWIDPDGGPMIHVDTTVEMFLRGYAPKEISENEEIFKQKAKKIVKITGNLKQGFLFHLGL